MERGELFVPKSQRHIPTGATKLTPIGFRISISDTCSERQEPRRPCRCCRFVFLLASRRNETRGLVSPKRMTVVWNLESMRAVRPVRHEAAVNAANQEIDP